MTLDEYDALLLEAFGISEEKLIQGKLLELENDNVAYAQIIEKQIAEHTALRTHYEGIVAALRGENARLQEMLNAEIDEAHAQIEELRELLDE